MKAELHYEAKENIPSGNRFFVSPVVQQIQHMLHEKVYTYTCLSEEKLLGSVCPEVFPGFKAERLPKTQALEDKWWTTWLSAPAGRVRHVVMTSSRLHRQTQCSKDLGAKREQHICLLMISGLYVTCWIISTIYLLGLEFPSVVNEGILPARDDLARTGPTEHKNKEVRI